MRCINCGWNNPANATNCEKCNSVLAEPTHDESSPRPEDDKHSYSETVRGAAPDMPYLDKQDSPQNEDSSKSCPKCGYPLVPGSLTCPNCHESVSNGNDVETKETSSESTEPQSDNITGTIDPYIIRHHDACKLKPIPRNGENDIESISFDSNTVLNRDVVDKDNKTISSKNQAELLVIDGKWFVVDKSNCGTTFVLAKEAVEIKNGDVILMGDRKFIVEM